MPIEPDPTYQDRFLHVVGDEPVVLHCHHYNAALQQVIEDASERVDAGHLLRDAAVAPVHHQMTLLFEGLAREARLPRAADHFREAGLGRLDLTALGPDGGVARLENSHYAQGFAARRAWGERSKPACHFVSGFLAGTLAAALDLPAGSFVAEETTCTVTTGGPCTFEVRRQTPPVPVVASVGVGRVPAVLPPAPPLPRPSPVDLDAIRAARTRVPLSGNEEGVIPAFGVYLARHYANYYNEVSFEFERRLTAHNPALAAVAAEVLVEAAHQCAFNTFGGMMQSPEWDAIVAPMLRERADWVFGVVGVIDTLGWGRFSVTDLVEGERLVLRVDGGYEANGYLARHGVGDRPRCHLATGAGGGIMNLLYVGDVLARPTLDLAYYDRLFSAEGTFRGQEHKCRAQGDDHCEVVVTRRDA